MESKNSIEAVMTRKGFKRAEQLSELLQPKMAFLDTNYRCTDSLAIYPVMKKAHLAHDLLALYGTHWLYLADHNLRMLMHDQDSGDLSDVLTSISLGDKPPQFACYVFTKKYLEQNRSLWLFVPGSEGWDFYNNVVAPKIRLDVNDYEKRKSQTIWQRQMNRNRPGPDQIS